jgi:hypothetical protein
MRETTMVTLTVWSVFKMSLEVMLGVGIKLFCDNGRIAWADVQNDFLFWLPGMERRPCDGLTRQVQDMALVDDRLAPLPQHADGLELLAAK